MDEAKTGPSDFTVQVLKGYAKDTGKDYDELLKMYTDFRGVLDKPGDKPEMCDERARAQVRTNIRSELASPAPVWSGMSLACGEAFDTNARHWANARALFAGDEKIQAINQGMITPDGKPIDRRKTFSTGRINRGFGRPYAAHNWMKNAFAVLSTAEGEPMPCKITLSRAAALKPIPLNVPVQTRLNNRTPKGVKDEYHLSSATITEFRQIEDPDIPHPEDIIEKYCAKYFTNLAGIGAQHEGFIIARRPRVRLNPIRLTLLDVYLLFLDTEPNERTGNYRMVVEDESVGFTEEDEGRRGTVIWVPAHLYPVIQDAGRGTRMYILGQTSQPQRSLDFETGAMTDKPGQVGLNATGIVIRRGWFMEKAVQEEFGEAVE